MLEKAIKSCTVHLPCKYIITIIVIIILEVQQSKIRFPFLMLRPLYFQCGKSSSAIPIKMMTLIIAAITHGRYINDCNIRPDPS